MRVMFVLLILFAGHASACVNTYETDILIMMYKGDPEEVAKTIRDLEATNAKAPSIQSRNDLAVAYILSGKYDEAVSILTNLEKDHPGLSRTASNLGTALELSGKNTEALHWIEEGITRDPQDHHGTEWLHVRVLEAKIALEKDPAWLRTHSVLGADFGSDLHPQMPSSLPADRFGRPGSLDEVEKAMDYQLKERLKFVTAPDPIVASLYRSRADIAYLQKSRSALDYYLSATFFGAKDDLAERRAQQFRTEYSANGSQSNTVHARSISSWVAYAAIAGLLALIALGVRFVRRARRTRLSNNVV